MLWNIRELTSKVLSELDSDKSTFKQIKTLIASCGFDTSKLYHLQQKSINNKNASKRELIDEVEYVLSKYDDDKLRLFLGCLIEKMELQSLYKDILQYGYIVENKKLWVIGDLIDNEKLDYIKIERNDFVRAVDALYRNDYLSSITLFIKSIETLANLSEDKNNGLPQKIKKLFKTLKLSSDDDYNEKISNAVEGLTLILSKYRKNKSDAHPHIDNPTKLDALIVMQISELIFYLYKKLEERKEKWKKYSIICL